MGQKKDTLRPQSRSGRSRSRSPKPKSKPAAVPQSYASEGVKNNDIFQLPGSDYKLIVLVTRGVSEFNGEQRLCDAAVELEL